MRNLMLSVLLILGDIEVNAEAAEYHQVYPYKVVIAPRGTDFLSPCLERDESHVADISNGRIPKMDKKIRSPTVEKSFSLEPDTKRELE